MVGMPYLAFLPAVSEDLYSAGAAGYGVLSACSAVGAVIAGLLTGPTRRRLGAWRLVVGAGGLFGFSLTILAVCPTFALAAVVLLLLGAGLLTFQTVTQSLLMTLGDATFHGRIQSLVVLSFGGFGLVALPLGTLADTVGLKVTFAGMGLFVLGVIAAFAAFSRPYRRRSQLRDLG